MTTLKSLPLDERTFQTLKEGDTLSYNGNSFRVEYVSKSANGIVMSVEVMETVSSLSFILTQDSDKSGWIKLFNS